MKVVVELKNVDENNDLTHSRVCALLEERDNNIKVTYVEDLSGDGRKTKTQMLISATSLRVTRRGELNSDFVYGDKMTHNTIYSTPFGEIPMTIVTKKFEFSLGHMGKSHTVVGNETATLWIEPDHFEEIKFGEKLPNDFQMEINIDYDICVEGQSAMPMSLGMKIHKE